MVIGRGSWLKSRRLLAHGCALVMACVLLGPAIAVALASGGTWTRTGNMRVARADPRMVLLADGEALIAGGLNSSFGSRSSAELFNPSTGTWSKTGSMSVPRASFVLRRLLNGEVLAAGGCHTAGNCATLTATAELYDPTTGTWSSTGSMPTPREGASSVVFPSGPLAGDVLVAGGCCDGQLPLNSTLLYNPQTGRWSRTGSMHARRLGSAITLLPSGEVLVSGGNGPSGSPLASAELYDPSSGQWSLTGSMSTGRVAHEQQLLPDGRVLAFGGFPGLASAELYHPATGRWTATGSMTDSRWDFSSAVLGDGTVLAAGGVGFSSDNLATAELYTPSTGRWTPTGSMHRGRESSGSVLLANGQFLMAGGFAFNPTVSTELYTP
jgi:hypothetical protein